METSILFSRELLKILAIILSSTRLLDWLITYSFKKPKAKFSVPYRVQPEDEIVKNFEGSFNTETNISNHPTIDSRVSF